MTCIMIVSHTNRLENFPQSPCTVPTCRYFLTLIVLHPPGWDCVAVCILYDKWSANQRRPYMAAGGGMVYWKNWIRLRDAKKHTIKAFWWFKGDLISQWIPNFIFVTRATRLIHNAGKYLLISIYPLPTHPTHNFTHKNGGNLDTLPGWPNNCISIDLHGAQVNHYMTSFGYIIMVIDYSCIIWFHLDCIMQLK